MNTDEWVFGVGGLATLAVWVGAGCLCRAWKNAVGISLGWPLLLGLVVLIVSSQVRSDREFVQAIAFGLVGSALTFLLPAAVVVASVTWIISNRIRRRKASKNLM